MSSTRERTSTRRKRQCIEESSSVGDLPEHPSKRFNSGIQLHSAAFYDSLSKVWLTPRALKELDRRNRAKSPDKRDPVRQELPRGGTRKKQIQRFARHGGLELRDLRGNLNFQMRSSKDLNFEQVNDRAFDEGEIMRDVIPIIAGDSDVLSKQNLPFTQLTLIADGTIVNAKPDFYNGARVEDIDKQVREDLGQYIIHIGHRAAPMAPNFFLEVKAPGGGADMAKRQACYDGALGTRLYAHYVTESADENPEYHMTKLRGFDTTDTRETFVEEATVISGRANDSTGARSLR
ncbi:hypothetical protein B7494_g1682 [Chlorociboria aeruginascens]|nr:hypothetical protein B7494_g1682 [Chlorociboria aeruginascens]